MGILLGSGTHVPRGRAFTFVVLVVPTSNSITGAFTITNGSLVAVVVSNPEISQDGLSKSTEQQSTCSGYKSSLHISN